MNAENLPDDVRRWYGVAFLGERDSIIEDEQTQMLINTLRHDASMKAFVDGLRVSMLTKNKFPTHEK